MTDLENDVRELLLLLPHLAGALERDGGTSAGPVVSGGADPAFGLPVNADVLAAVHTLDVRVPRIARWAAGVVAEQYLPRSIEGHVRHFPRWHERMLVTAAADAAGALVDEAHTTLRYVKSALGLATPDRRLGQFCPLHDEPLTELVVPGDVAVMGYGPTGPSVVWRHGTDAVCRSCGAAWAPSQLLTLGRLMRDADRRRVAKQQDFPSRGKSSGMITENSAAGGAR